MPEEANFLMGTDPEIVFLDPQGRLMRAADYLPHPHDERVPSELGSDGHRYIAELRPPPGNPEKLVNDLYRILKQNYKRLPDGTQWKAGSFVQGKPLGGHIHYNFTRFNSLIDALDGVLAQVLCCGENNEEARARRAGNYGHLGDTRPQPHGFEYRTPSSFIVSKTVSLGIFALAKAIAYEEIAKEKFSIPKLKGKLGKAVKVDRNRYLVGDRAHFISLLPTLWQIITKYTFWKTQEGTKLWAATAGLKTLANYPTGWDNGVDILNRWKVVSERKILKSRKPSKVIIRQVADVDLWNELADVNMVDMAPLD